MPPLISELRVSRSKSNSCSNRSVRTYGIDTPHVLKRSAITTEYELFRSSHLIADKSGGGATPSRRTGMMVGRRPGDDNCILRAVWYSRDTQAEAVDACEMSNSTTSQWLRAVSISDTMLWPGPISFSSSQVRQAFASRSIWRRRAW